MNHERQYNWGGAYGTYRYGFSWFRYIVLQCFGHMVNRWHQVGGWSNHNFPNTEIEVDFFVVENTSGKIRRNTAVAVGPRYSGGYILDLFGSRKQHFDTLESSVVVPFFHKHLGDGTERFVKKICGDCIPRHLSGFMDVNHTFCDW